MSRFFFFPARCVSSHLQGKNNVSSLIPLSDLQSFCIDFSMPSYPSNFQNFCLFSCLFVWCFLFCFFFYFSHEVLSFSVLLSHATNNTRGIARSHPFNQDRTTLHPRENGNLHSPKCAPGGGGRGMVTMRIKFPPAQLSGVKERKMVVKTLFQGQSFLFPPMKSPAFPSPQLSP